MFKRLAPLVLSLLFAAPALAKDELAIGITQFPATLNPSIESMLAKTYVLAFAQRPITAYDASWQLICLLCETLPSMENGLAKVESLPGGKKGIAATYTLRADSRWADGKPVTSDDVVFSWEVGRHPQSGVAAAELFRRITRIEVKDARSFTLHVDKLTFDYNAINDLRLLPAHIEGPRFKSAPAEYRNRTAYDQDSTNPGLYNGPYRITAVVQGSHVVLEPNSHWGGAKPAFKRIVIKAIENTASLEANLLSGGVDMIAGELGLPLEQAIAFEKRHGARFNVVTKPSLTYEHLDLNLGSPILADLKVRRALLLGLDRETMSRQLFEGRQIVAESLVPPLDWVYAADLPKASFDPVRAASLLDEAGWKPGPGGIRVNAKGERLALDLVTTAGNRSREMVAQVMQSQWKKIGVELRLKTEPPRILFGDTVTRRKFPHMALFAWYSAPESVPRSSLHSAMVPNAANNWSGQNYTGYASPAMDRLIDSVEVELDKDKRKALWREIQALYAADLPALPLFFKSDSFILPKALKGLVPTGHQDPSPYWVENWRWE
ncbi:Oligopeptide ABC transporter periplasmic oligopeptide-binding protein OppA [Paramagnetospirillum magnetotacticum MS-1]|uniref:Oligopeptide ABC transporter periplasmic oligopeptide-binding protein OppA n=1 Tax=Paramagnetospirillum magnetotacticum MS-1 TaxID=272627 RepID=A0A0C2YZ77_PARME|nr:peptide ABC transporter substrate-binding protein [Paramagnetospirillum magnetotacticum]KIM00394.1 Oligopeptide ABC transporter periplasmic oligopeptide-binding protein OppA [Paramagnetospirillum magnetotacticum MS-1]